MATDGTEDRFQVIGSADDDTDVISCSGAGTYSTPVAGAICTHFPIGAGVPMEMMGGFGVGFSGGFS